MILLTGGSGLLGRELRKYLKCYAPTRKQLDITKKIKPLKDVSMVIHCAAYTDVVKAETDRKACFDVNVKGTQNLIDAYPDVPFVYISTEYVDDPVNHYAATKQLGEDIVKNDKRLIIRTSFSPRPFPHKYAFFDQLTNGDYVDVIAPLIIKEISYYDWCGEVLYVGTHKKTMLELARQTKPKIKGISVGDIKGVKIPTNV